jgi:sigma-B regulation protein RsbU (phosphoserine phosphatase)
MPSPSVPLSDSLPASILAVLDTYYEEHGVEVRLWFRVADGWVLAYTAGTDAPAASTEPGSCALQVSGVDEMEVWVEAVGCAESEGHASARFLAGVLRQLFRHDSEARFFGRELAERYEEITLLYTISEILGSVISLETAAGTILTEVVDAMGVRRASLWVHDRERAHLELAAAVGGDGQTGPIPEADPCSVTAEVFRSRRPMIFEPGDVFPRGDCPPIPATREYFLSVPVSYTPPEGETRTTGVINLVGRVSEEPFSAGDLKLISAIASQVGAAVENGRLVAESLRRERMVREMELAHDLQLKLLPSVEQFAGYAEVAARCVPAESVGGDFYHLFRLPGGRLGVMIGDVSSHGFGAALIMALTMSAVAIHASEGDPPGEVLRRVHRALIDELESTEMYLTLFYGVIDPGEGRITYANAGHPYAFRIPSEGPPERLSATNPPFGIVDLDGYHESCAAWVSGEDLLLLFTDGLPDSLGADGTDGGDFLLGEVLAGRHAAPEDLVERIFSLRSGEASAPPDDRTAMLVRI